MAEKFNVVEMREDREHEFVNMALTAACAKTVSARDLLAVCPLGHAHGQGSTELFTEPWLLWLIQVRR